MYLYTHKKNTLVKNVALEHFPKYQRLNIFFFRTDLSALPLRMARIGWPLRGLFILKRAELASSEGAQPKSALARGDRGAAGAAANPN